MNKNTKRVRTFVKDAARKKQGEITIERPVNNYHSSPGLTKVNIPVAHGSGVISRNTRRNMQMRIMTNPGGGANSSLTVHEKINKDMPAFPKPRTDNGGKNKRSNKQEE